MATTEAFGLYTILAAEFSGGIFIGSFAAQEQHEEVGVTLLTNTYLWNNGCCTRFNIIVFYQAHSTNC